MTLDIRTLVIANLLVDLVGIVMLRAYASRRRTLPGFGRFILSFAASVLGAVSLGFRGPVPVLASVLLANLFQSSFVLLRVDALLTFETGRPLPAWVYGFAPAFALLQLGLALRGDSLPARVLLASVMGATGAAASAWILLRLRRPGADGVRLLMACANAALGAFLVWRVGIWIVAPPRDLFAGDPALVGFFLFFIVFEVTQSVGLVMLNAERLEESLAKSATDLAAVRTDLGMLEGLLPICASCKSIREPEGVWSPLEKYVHEHTEARFSHGLCPQCMTRLYPDYAASLSAGSGSDHAG